jgi:hypothetical protein
MNTLTSEASSLGYGFAYAAFVRASRMRLSASTEGLTFFKYFASMNGGRS